MEKSEPTITEPTGPGIPAAITALSVADIAHAIELWETTPGIGLSSADDPEELRAFLRHNTGLSFKASVPGRDGLAGTILCGSDGRRGYIYHLAVATDCRRAGIARVLVDRVTTALEDRGIQKAHAMVFADNADGRAAWAALGWSLRDDLVVYSHSLDPG